MQAGALLSQSVTKRRKALQTIAERCKALQSVAKHCKALHGYRFAAGTHYSLNGDDFSIFLGSVSPRSELQLHGDFGGKGIGFRNER